ncbi:hypothetical protein CONLIGDRAFT_102153 [Coniochaeta ligniaria NRRL 30616]|uniref:Uncharacterized protein n=1 Tax=Coniochaeta ligniaria NRRL 30616 TaxID=1408157 RepID=A0A1J7JAR3_9PEZI|nr:hypothetical protein CONLIGDRAFT_102153 [Coniochaeta ligniaria NRRL 30616]
MCYIVITHTMRCDVRPIVAIDFDCTNPSVDPYATPGACQCQGRDAEIRLRLRCGFGHNCCYISHSKKTSCGVEDCKEPVLFHKYIRRSISSKGLFGDCPAQESDSWPTFPVIDGHLCELNLAPRMTAEFVRTREKLLAGSKSLYELANQWADNMSEVILKARRLHDLVHVSNRPSSEQYDTRCLIRYESDNFLSESNRLLRQTIDIRDDVARSFFQLLLLEGDGQGTITGLLPPGRVARLYFI